MKVTEIPVVFSCLGNDLVGIVHNPERGQRKGLLIIVGGPQTRVGSHRQFVSMARFLAARGVPVFRFDYRGMGDSEGPVVSFEEIKTDIGSAIDVFQDRTGIHEVALWGICDAASAASFYAYKDSRVSGIVMLNPWVRTETGIARTYMKSHYSKRLLDKEFWRKVGGGRFNYHDSMFSFFRYLMDYLKSYTSSSGRQDRKQALPIRMANDLSLFSGPILIILSGNDLTAEEFRNQVKTYKEWVSILDRKNTTLKNIPGADHTFSNQQWTRQVEEWTFEWLCAVSH